MKSSHTHSCYSEKTFVTRLICQFFFENKNSKSTEKYNLMRFFKITKKINSKFDITCGKSQEEY